MLQSYLRNEGLLLSWVCTGRVIFSLNYTDADFDEVVARFVRPAGKWRRTGSGGIRRALPTSGCGAPSFAS